MHGVAHFLRLELAGLAILALSTLPACQDSSPVAPRLDQPRLDAAFARARQIDNLTSLAVAQSGVVLRELYRKGKISYREYKDQSDYFDQIIDSEAGWLSDTGRW